MFKKTETFISYCRHISLNCVRVFGCKVKALLMTKGIQYICVYVYIIPQIIVNLQPLELTLHQSESAGESAVFRVHVKTNLRGIRWKGENMFNHVMFFLFFFSEMAWTKRNPSNIKPRFLFIIIIIIHLVAVNLYRGAGIRTCFTLHN